MRYYIIAGELSGDLHASYLLSELKKQDSDAVFRGFGGEKMENAGCFIVKSLKDLAFMGFVEVVTHLKKVLNNIKECKEDIKRFNADAVILVDYPGFNLRIAKFVKQLNIPIFYYISPSVWAWKKGRIKTMKRLLTKLYVILPFEKDFFAQNNMEVCYFGNPLVDEIADFRRETTVKINDGKPLIVLMPGSRTQEINKMLPLQVKIADKYPQYHFAVAAVNTHNRSFYEKFTGNRPIDILYNSTYSLLNSAYAAIVCSGTATLETALFNVPQIVCYKANIVSWYIGRLVANVKYISLVNLILNRECVVELLQDKCNIRQIDTYFQKIVLEEKERIRIHNDYIQLNMLLGKEDTSKKIANDIYTFLSHKK
ncbi:MAG: lipid-A-disaccharide synthase [Bacteroidales bacterium]|jgi:lipid-A-disaccharide synthase|nr:lipid-A-disaccharide synthase [Bacteroidales bacterium]